MHYKEEEKTYSFFQSFRSFRHALCAEEKNVAPCQKKSFGSDYVVKYLLFVYGTRNTFNNQLTPTNMKLRKVLYTGWVGVVYVLLLDPDKTSEFKPVKKKLNPNTIYV